MNEKKARNKLQQILENLCTKPGYFELKIGANGFIDYHVNWIKTHSQKGWDEHVARARLAAVEEGLDQENQEDYNLMQ